jgi:peroxiredoxin
MRATLRITALACVALVSSAALAQRVGKPAPEFESSNQFNTKDKVALENFKGKIVVLVFWRTTDSESIDAIATLNEMHKKFRKGGVVVIAHSPEEKEKVESIVKGKEIEYLVIYGDKVHETYKVTSFPRVFLIDTRGVVTWRGHPADELEDRVKEQMRKTPPAGSDEKALRNRLSKAQTLHDSGEHGRAYTLAKDVADVADEAGEIGGRAKTLVEEIEKAARKWLDDARDSIRSGNYEDACRRIAEISVRFAGSDLGADAGEECAKLKGDRSTKSVIRKAIANAKGELQNDQAADLEAGSQYIEALDAYREVTESYADTDAAEVAETAIERIKTDPKIQARIKAARADERANRWLDLGDRFAKVEMYDLARQNYEKIVEQHPKSRAATKAKKRLADLPAGTKSEEG